MATSIYIAKSVVTVAAALLVGTVVATARVSGSAVTQLFIRLAITIVVGRVRWRARRGPGPRDASFGGEHAW